MPKPSGDSISRPRALFLSPEAPYPRIGGGALRSSALLEYLRDRFVVDVVTFASEVPDSVHIELDEHSRSHPARAWRQLRRFVRRRPPLFDRFSGYESEVLHAVAGSEYDVAVIEHFWCAPYARVLRPNVRRLILDLHNTESGLARTTAGSEQWPVSVAFRSFARAYERLERTWLPQFDAVLTTSFLEAMAARKLGANAIVYPNTIPIRPRPEVAPDHAVLFTGNLEYQANISAVRWFARAIWPLVHERAPELEWRLAGKNPWAIEREVADVAGVRIIGPMEDAIVEIARAKVALAPLLAGSGTRFKILEAWCAGTPIVSTRLGAEGLDVRDGIDIAIADEPVAFARRVLDLVEDPSAREHLAGNGREVLEQKYTLERGWQLLDESGVFRV